LPVFLIRLILERQPHQAGGRAKVRHLHRALLVRRQVLLHLLTLGGGQFPIYKRAQHRLELLARRVVVAHGWLFRRGPWGEIPHHFYSVPTPLLDSSNSRYSLSTFCTLRRAWNSRDITVPLGMSSVRDRSS